MKKSWLLILLFLLGLLSLVFVYNKYYDSSKNASIIGSSDEWVTYEATPYGFSLKYPKDAVVSETQQNSSDERFLRIQNYAVNDISRSVSEKYWIEFFAFAKDTKQTSCPRNIVDYETNDLDNSTVYSGVTKADINTGVGGGLQAVCIDNNDYDIYIQGQDTTSNEIVSQILDSVQFIK